jgi:hypothetical protein
VAAAAGLARGGGEVLLPVGLAVPGGARALVVFALGGSGSFSPRNRRVAAWLRQELGTLLMDLLTADDERIDRRTAELRFDIDLLAECLVGGGRLAGERARDPRPGPRFLRGQHRSRGDGCRPRAPPRHPCHRALPQRGDSGRAVRRRVRR